MHSFSDFAADSLPLDGDKVRIDDILNIQITVLAYSIKQSKYNKNNSGLFLTMQFEHNEARFICFTGSDVLISQFQKYGDMVPFTTTIKKIDRYYTLS